ncbi:PP2C family serine/threonine-protein phosphatase [Kocuria rhizophila]|uniref:PP2C family protein-serine/threonine phosphatase n=1 Tax=Kocuria rhizophila TaxID=72000 RepID=UPI0011A628D9|nr:protein phosphatase 2C domain-containing protein [Kocuria rhizophila]WTI32117.1 protein phosphatase 2C domain-containing protein [Kocuria rhizophila]
MPIAFRYAARSDVGRVRSKNDDSAYAGRYLAVVADGMGGHVGGDVASASAVIDLTHLDHAGHRGEAETVLADEIQNANQNLAKLVQSNPRLGGMGTTVTALLIDGDEISVAHIGDSRAYRLSETEGFQQVTTDHTFVQRLIDEGRLQPEEAETHPHKNVLMRVLGDVDASPELEVRVVRPAVGERWLLCSDGLNAVVNARTIENVMRSTGDLNQIVNSLVELTLDRGAPDNVTVVVVQVDEIPPGDEAHPMTGEGHGAIPDESRTSDERLRVETVEEHWDGPMDSPVAGGGVDYREPGRQEPPAPPEPAQSSASVLRQDLAERPHLLVGAAANATQTGRIPTVSDSAMARRATMLSTSTLDETTDPAEVRSLLRRKGEDPAPPSTRRRAVWVAGTVVLAVALMLGGWGARAWTSSQYYVGEDQGRVAVYQGVSQSLGPISLSDLDSTTDVRVDSLSQYAQERVRATIPAGSRDEAEKIVSELKTSSGPGPHPTGRVTVTTPTPDPSSSASGSGSPSSSASASGGGDS